MNAVRTAALLLVAAVAGVAYVDAGSETASRIRDHRPLAGLLAVRHERQPAVTPPALYLVVAGTGAGTLDLVRVPADFPVYERAADGNTVNHRTLADAYAAGAETSMLESATTILQSETAWPEAPSPVPGEGRPQPLDFAFSLTLPRDARPGFPRDMKRALSARLRDPLFWPRLALDADRLPMDSRYDALLLAREFRRISPKRVRTAELTDPTLAHRLLSRVFARASGHNETEGIVDVEVLNAAETDGLALKATKVLRLQGFDVKHFGNAETVEKSTRFLDRAGIANGAGDVADALGCGNADVVTALAVEPRAAVTVLLGKDFSRCAELAQD